MPQYIRQWNLWKKKREEQGKKIVLGWGGEEEKHHKIKWSGLGIIRKKKDENCPAHVMTASIFKIIKLHTCSNF